MIRRFYLFCIFFAIVLPVHVFAQQGAAGVRNYVGLINQSYHPGIVSYFEKVKEELTNDENDVIRSIDIFLSGAFGSGFLYNDESGNFYVITNNHVVAQAHTLSITFESPDGTRTRFENLRIIATDEDKDLAILAFPAGETPPVPRGLSFLARPVEEGEEVFSAGFPGLGITPLWQFGNGRISNAFARFPRSIDDNTLMGPFIQHTAQVDSGNSGGPLLVSQPNVPSGFAVAGINTLKGTQRQAANYAIPVNTVQTFIREALNPDPETFRAALEQRLDEFVEGLGVNRAVYPHIARFLAAVCIGENAEFAFEEMMASASRTVRRNFVEHSREDLIGAMGIAVAWTIEDSIRDGTGVLRTSIKDIYGSGEEYTVVFTINDNDVSSVWIREYGNWRIKTFGSIATGEQTRAERITAQGRASRGRLRTDSFFNIELGYAYLFKKAPASLYASLNFRYFGINFYFAGPQLISIGIFGGFEYAFKTKSNNYAFTPYIRFGIAYLHDRSYTRDFGFPISINLQTGLKFTMSYVPGLYFNLGYQYNIYNMLPSDNPWRMALIFSVGYSF